MTLVETQVDSMGSRFRRLVERMLPWYDPDDTRRRNERTERVRQRAIASRLRAEAASRAIRADYASYAARVRR